MAKALAFFGSLAALVSGSHAAALRANKPPVGAVYERTLLLPVIGQQGIKLTILSDEYAVIKLSGTLAVEERLWYGVDTSTGKLKFVLGEHVVRLLRRLGVALTDAEYAQEGDLAFVQIAPPFIPAIRIRLARQPVEVIFRAPPAQNGTWTDSGAIEGAKGRVTAAIRSRLSLFAS